MDERIQIVRATIRTEFGRVLDLEELARLVNLSPSRLRHLFKMETGKTPAQYLKSVRMQEAHVLIRTTFLSVKEIRNRVGISDDSHFAHDFKKAYGLSPSTYRNTMKRSTPLSPSSF